VEISKSRQKNHGFSDKAEMVDGKPNMIRLHNKALVQIEEEDKKSINN
jgi:hypothetical protein